MDDLRKRDHHNRMGARGGNRDRESLVAHESRDEMGVECRFFLVLCACHLKLRIKFDII